MKIVFATDQYWPTITGVSVSIDAFRHEFRKQGHQVFILAPDHPGYDDADADDTVFRFKSLSVFITKENRLVKYSERKAICQTLDRLKPDIIHVHTELPMGKICLDYARQKKIPVVASAHTNWEELLHLYVPFIPQHLARLYTRARMRRFYNLADAIVVPTSLMETLLHLYFVTKPTKVIPTGITRLPKEKSSASKTRTSPLFKKYPQLRNKRIMLFVGRLGREKNIPFLFDVLLLLKDKFPNLILLITGDGPERENLIRLVDEKGLSDRVVFTGFVEKKKINDYYRIADVFVFASMVESQGLVVLEAMACGIPAVAIGRMGTREVMSGDNGGYMVDDDQEIFAERVSLLLRNKKIHREKCAEARHHADKWGIDVMAEKMLSLYEKIISRK